MAMEVRCATEIKKQNVASIKRILLEMGSVTKPEVSERTGLSVVTCGSILNELTSKGILVEESLRLSSGGRPAMGYRFSENVGNHLCLFLYTEESKFFIRYQVQDISGKVMESGVFRDDILQIEKITESIGKICRPELNIKVIAAGIQGRISNNIVESTNLVELRNVNIADKIKEATGITTLVESDMNALALGYTQLHREKLDLNQIRNVAILFFPVGHTPAGGYIVDGNILRGANNLAGDFAFVPFCASKEERDIAYSSMETARPLIDMFLVSTAACLDPAVIVITGGLSNQLKETELLDSLRKQLQRSRLPKLEISPMLADEYYAGLHCIAVNHLIEG